MSKRKKLQELTIRDNFMFGAVMVDEELCRELLELILGFQIAKVTVSREKSFIFHPEYRGIRLDVIASDENGLIMMWKCRFSEKRTWVNAAVIIIARLTWSCWLSEWIMSSCQIPM